MTSDPITNELPHPWVTVICTCYNHGPYISEAIFSIVNQTYPNIELIVIDNASTDHSVTVIKNLIEGGINFRFIQNKVNKGICKAFNEVAKLAKGKYLIDLSGDDILLPDRIKLQVQILEEDSLYGMAYSNIQFIDHTGKILGDSKKLHNYPSGYIFENLLADYIIPSPSTIFRASTFYELGGYNEALAFEDFDFWIRCAYQYPVAFSQEILTQKRILKNSFSNQFYSITSDIMLRSTLMTYLWAKERIRTKTEREALQKGMSYYFKQCVLLGHFKLAEEYLSNMYPISGFKNNFALFLLKWKIRWPF